MRLGPAARNGRVGADERQGQVNGRRAERYPRKLPVRHKGGSAERPIGSALCRRTPKSRGSSRLALWLRLFLIGRISRSIVSELFLWAGRIANKSFQTSEVNAEICETLARMKPFD